MSCRITRYLRRRSLPFVEDPSNADPRFARARLRHELLPLLARENPRVREALVGLAAVPSAQTAPFCVRAEGLAPQCLYVDTASCNARARQMHGECTINTDELHIAPGIGHFCMVSSQSVSSCVYLDSGSCDAEARRSPTRRSTKPGDPIEQKHGSFRLGE